MHFRAMYHIFRGADGRLTVGTRCKRHIYISMWATTGGELGGIVVVGKAKLDTGT